MIEAHSVRQIIKDIFAIWSK